jgi:hypothetical protein
MSRVFAVVFLCPSLSVFHAYWKKGKQEKNKRDRKRRGRER